MHTHPHFIHVKDIGAILHAADSEQVVHVCKQCMGERKTFTGQRADLFVGTAVKLAFPTKIDTSKHEGMWVQVTHANQHEHDLVGYLANEPVYEMAYNFGCSVAFNIDEILEVHQKPPLKSVDIVSLTPHSSLPKTYHITLKLNEIRYQHIVKYDDGVHATIQFWKMCALHDFDADTMEMLAFICRAGQVLH